MRFTIRELLLVTVIVGLGVGWWIDHRQSWQIRARNYTRYVNQDMALSQMDGMLLDFPKGAFYDLMVELARQRRETRGSDPVRP
jgi:hypothetical protein